MMAMPSPYMRLLIADVERTLMAPDSVLRGFADRGGHHERMLAPLGSRLTLVSPGTSTTSTPG
jgi:hypothetical protein